MHSIPQLLAVAFALTALAAADQPVGFRGSEKAPVTVIVFSDFESLSVLSFGGGARWYIAFCGL
jgi:hypothetical protein